MPTATSDSDLSLNQRFHQIAAILARGVRRHRHLARRCQSKISENFGEPNSPGLEVLGETRLSVSRTQG